MGLQSVDIRTAENREISPISPHESLPLRIARPPHNFRARSHFYFNKAVIFFSGDRDSSFRFAAREIKRMIKAKKLEF